MQEFGCLGYLIDNKYTIISEYGSGRQGIIYEVSRIPDNTRYALKVVKHHRKVNVNQIVDNYLIASKSGIGPNVIDSGQCREGDIKYSYIVMTLLSGPSLKVYGYLDPKVFVNSINLYWRLFLQYGVKHLDYKPDNFVYHNDKLYLVDYDSSVRDLPYMYSIKHYNKVSRPIILYHIRRYDNYRDLLKLLDDYWVHVKSQYQSHIAKSINSPNIMRQYYKLFEIIEDLNFISIHLFSDKKIRLTRLTTIDKIHRYTDDIDITSILTRKEFVKELVDFISSPYEGKRIHLFLGSNSTVISYNEEIINHPRYIPFLDLIVDDMNLKHIEIPTPVSYDIIHCRRGTYKWEPSTVSPFASKLNKYPTSDQVYNYIYKHVMDKISLGIDKPILFHYKNRTISI